MKSIVMFLQLRFSRLRGSTISVIVLGLFIFLAILATYPIASNLNEFTVLHTFKDDLLESWTIEWVVHSFLTEPAAIWRIWEANIFFPYPLTLAFTEHLLSTSFLLMPFALLGSTPLAVTNLGVLFTTALSGWGMYLLVTWLTGNRWAGAVAGLSFAIAPFRLSHITQLHLISTQWIPFIFLVTARLIKFNRSSDLILLIIFTSLQFFAVVNYAPLIAMGLVLWVIFCLVLYRKRVTPSLFLRLLTFGLVTIGLNWPILRIYQQVSDRIGIVRTLGDASVYGASIINYILPIGNSLLYGRWLHLPTQLDYLFPGVGIFVSTFPGVVVFLLAVIGIVLSLKSKTNRPLTVFALALVLIVVVGFFFSFGANEAAFGTGMSSIVEKLLPYTYLYNILPFLQGLRVPLRFALLTTFGLAVLAGIGFALLMEDRLRAKYQSMAATLVIILILIEHLPAPLPGVFVPYGGQVYSWLANAPKDAVVLEMPYYLHTERSFMELLREYQSTIHWQRLVNGASGFKPEWMIKLGPVLDGFPDWRSFDVVRQLGVNYIVLHHDQYSPQDWDNLMALLPGYLPDIESIHTVGDDLIIQLRPPACVAKAKQVAVDAGAFPTLSISNNNPATFVADPHYASSITIEQQRQEFLEPLFVLPGQIATFDLLLDTDPVPADWQVELANLDQTLTPANSVANLRPNYPLPSDLWQPVQIPFANGAVLQAMALSQSPATCGAMSLNFEWAFANFSGETVRVELIDRFSRLVVSNDSQPRVQAEPILSSHILYLAETIPPGQYKLRIQLLAADGSEISPVNQNGGPVGLPLSLPLIIRPGTKQKTPVPQSKISRFANGVKLLGIEGMTREIRTGAWIRFTLNWQSESHPATDYTVFTQFLGPDGQVWGQHDNPPHGGWYPISLWTPGEIVADDYAVRLDPAAPAGEYHLIVGMYDPATGERVSITDGPGQGNNFVDAATIVVSTP